MKTKHLIGMIVSTMIVLTILDFLPLAVSVVIGEIFASMATIIGYWLIGTHITGSYEFISKPRKEDE